MIFTFSVRFYDPTIVGCPSEHQGEWQFVLILGFRLPVGAWNELISVREEPNDESWNNVTPHRYHLFFQQRGKCILLLSVHRWLRNCTYPLLLNNLMCYSCCDQMDGRYKERTKRQRASIRKVDCGDDVRLTISDLLHKRLLPSYLKIKEFFFSYLLSSFVSIQNIQHSQNSELYYRPGQGRVG